MTTDALKLLRDEMDAQRKDGGGEGYRAELRDCLEEG
jgi:hypothetical protein